MTKAFKKSAAPKGKAAKVKAAQEDAQAKIEAVATVATQVRVGDKIVTVNRGAIMQFDELPPNFLPIGDFDVNFAKDSYDVLMACDWDVADAVKFVKDTYGTQLDIEGKSKSEIVKGIIDARERGTL